MEGRWSLWEWVMQSPCDLVTHEPVAEEQWAISKAGGSPGTSF